MKYVLIAVACTNGIGGLLYIAQGGLGMGRYPFDLPIVLLLLLPGIIAFPLAGAVPLSLREHLEFFFVLVLPILLNLLVAQAIRSSVAKRMRRLSEQEWVEGDKRHT